MVCRYCMYVVIVVVVVVVVVVVAICCVCCQYVQAVLHLHCFFIEGVFILIFLFIAFISVSDDA